MILYILRNLSFIFVSLLVAATAISSSGKRAIKQKDYLLPLQLNPAERHLAKGLRSIVAGDLKGAAEEIQKAIDSSKPFAEASFAQAKLLIEQGLLDEANAKIGEITKVYGEGASVSRLRSQLYFTLGDTEKALREARLALGEENPAIATRDWLWYSNLQYELGEFRGAIGTNLKTLDRINKVRQKLTEDILSEKSDSSIMDETEDVSVSRDMDGNTVETRHMTYTIIDKKVSQEWLDTYDDLSKDLAAAHFLTVMLASSQAGKPAALAHLHKGFFVFDDKDLQAKIHFAKREYDKAFKYAKQVAKKGDLQPEQVLIYLISSIAGGKQRDVKRATGMLAKLSSKSGNQWIAPFLEAQKNRGSIDSNEALQLSPLHQFKLRFYISQLQFADEEAEEGRKQLGSLRALGMRDTYEEKAAFVQKKLL